MGSLQATVKQPNLTHSLQKLHKFTHVPILNMS